MEITDVPREKVYRIIVLVTSAIFYYAHYLGYMRVSDAVISAIFLGALYYWLKVSSYKEMSSSEIYQYYTNSMIFMLSTLYAIIMIPMEARGPWGILGALAYASLTYAAGNFVLWLSYIYEHMKKYLAVKKAERELRRRLQLRKPPLLKRIDPLMISFTLLPLTIMTIFLLIPVTIIIKNAFIPPQGSSDYLYWIKEVFTGTNYVRPRPLGDFFVVDNVGGVPVLYLGGARITWNMGILINSLIVATTVTLTATLFGLILAFIMARYEFPGKTIMRVLVLVPMFIIPFANGIALKALLSSEGFLSVLLHDYLKLLPWRIHLQGLAGVMFLQIMTFTPIAYLNSYSSFLNIDPNLEEQAENLGAKGLRLFLTVTLPLALPGIAAGSILVFIFSLEDLAGPIVFNEHNLLSYQIYSRLINEATQGRVLPEIAAAAMILLLFALMGFAIIRSYVSLKQYAMISKGGRWKPRSRKLSPIGTVFAYIILLSILMIASVPQVGTILLTFGLLTPYGQLTPDTFTTNYFVNILESPNINVYIKNSLLYASLALLLMLAISIPAAYAVSRGRARLLAILDALVTLPIAIPGLVVAVGLFYFYSSWPFRGTPFDPTSINVYNAMYVLVVAYGVRKVPFMARSVFAGLQQTHKSLEEAAMNLGASRAKVITSIVIPLILMNILTGILLGFIYSTTEVSVSITLGGIKQEQAPLTWYMKQMVISGTQAVYNVAALGTLLIIIQLVAVMIIVLGFKQSYAFISL
ncbi:MAG: iron ABC transporter permease [Desulfurococcales archaeon]|nr:iron ABC transporter permease [Desulfurococcales archaeon]